MKPYPAYKDSGVEWIGEIPEGWDVRKLKHLADVKLSNIDKKSKEDEPTVKLCNYVDVYYNDNITPNIKFMVASASRDQINVLSLEKGDVLITKDSESSDDIAVPAFVPESLAGIVCGYHLARIRPNEDAHGNYLFRSFLSNGIRDQFEMNANGITRFGIGKYTIDNSHFLVPPLAEQQSIATFLDNQTAKIDTLIENKQKQIELLKEERTAIINQAVTKGLNPDVPMRDSGIEWLGEIPEHWELRKLKYLSSINPTKSNSSFNKNSDELVTFLPMEKVSEDGDIDTRSKKPIKDLWDGLTYFEENDVIVSKITPCFENGKGAFLKNLGSKIGFGSTEFHVLRAKISEIHPHYLYYVTRTNMFKKLGEAAMTGAAGQKRVTNSFIQNFFVSFPTKLEEQDEIVRQIKLKQSSMDELISQIQNQITLLQKYRIALISEAVTGKIDLRNQHEIPTFQ